MKKGKSRNKRKKTRSERSNSRVLEGTKKVVDDSNGTGYAAHRDDILLAGKTGTVERPILIISMVEDVKGRGGSGYVVKKDNLVLEEWFGSN